MPHDIIYDKQVSPSVASLSQSNARSARMSSPPLFATSSPNGATLTSFFLPSSCNYALHRHPDYFADPHRFLPERWLPGTPAHAEQLSKPGPAMTPFGIGSRHCPGRSMALLNVSLIIARAVWLYDFRKADGEVGRARGGSPTVPKGRRRVNEFQLQATTTSMSEGPYLVFRDRLDNDERCVAAT